MTQLHVLEHPLAAHHLSTLRDQGTRPAEFRAAVARLATLIGVYATEGLRTGQCTITTPVAETVGHRLQSQIGIVPVLRAGLGMVEPLLNLIPDAAVWHLGMYRNEATAEPIGYYDKLPNMNPPEVALVLDPMLATGGSIEMVVRRLMGWGVGEIRVLSIIASQPGVDRIVDAFPEVGVFVAAVDPELNDSSFIVPGLGDAGDRIFDTPSAAEEGEPAS